MKTINLRWIYPHSRQDVFVEVSEEIWEAMRQAQREMYNYERRKVYHRAYYSLDAYSWTENYALEHGRSPEEIFLEREEQAARLRLVSALPEALSHATPTQGRRVFAYYIAGISQPEISRRERVSTSKVSVAIRRGLRNMRRYYGTLLVQTISRFIVSAPGVLLLHRSNASRWDHARSVPPPTWRRWFLCSAVPA